MAVSDKRCSPSDDISQSIVLAEQEGCKSSEISGRQEENLGDLEMGSRKIHEETGLPGDQFAVCR